MKFKLKSILAAFALAGMSASAMAAIQSGTAAGGSELVFYAFDDIAGTSYVKDLGVTFSGFLAAPTFSSVNIAADSNWTSYKTSVGGDTGNTRWGILANVFTGTGAGGFKILTTASGNAPTVSGQSSSIFSAVNGTFNTSYLGDLGDASAVSVNSSYFSPASNLNSDNWSVLLQHNLAGKLKYSTDNAIGFTANFYQESRAAGTAAPSISASIAQWQFDGSNLATVAAVPEPETYGMLLAGLALIGSIVRRRRA